MRIYFGCYFGCLRDMVFTFMMIDRDSVIKLSMMRYMTAVFFDGF